MNDLFNQTIDRSCTNSYKVDAKPYYDMPEDIHSLWVADMDFATAPCIVDTLQRRINHPIYGYTFIPDAYYEAVISWMKTRHNWPIEKEWIIPTPNIGCGISLILHTLLDKGDKVLIQQPVYNGFETAIKTSGCTPVNNALIHENGYYTIDFKDFEEKVKDPKVKAFILCSPHNPVGRVWTKKELTKLGQLCTKHGVLIIADEIHHDLIYKDVSHTSMGTLSDEISDHLVVCTSPSKTFNLSGIGCANMIIKNTSIREPFAQNITGLSLHKLSPLAIDSLIAAYQEGGPWADALVIYLEENKDYAANFIHTNLPMLKIAPCQATYLLWIDMRALNLTQSELMHFLTHKAKLWVNDGTTYDPSYTGFIRMNFALPRPKLEQALHALKAAIEVLLK